MTAHEALAQLEKLGKPATAAIYARHGVKEPRFGVSYADLKAMAKKIGPNQQVASALWKSGVHEARVLATMVAEPGRMSRADIEAWVKDVSSYPITDAVAGVAAAMPEALEMAQSWIRQKGEWVSSAGWTVLGMIGARSGLPRADAEKLLDTIEKTIHAQPNRTRYAMNNVLIGIGGYVEPLRARALQVARAIGTVHVDHGETGCKTPDAASYIAKLVAYEAGRKTKKAGVARTASRTAPVKAAGR